MSLIEKLQYYVQQGLSALNRNERLVGVDIGTSSVRIVLCGDDGQIVKAGVEPISADCFASGVITKPEKVGSVIRQLCESLDIKDLRAATAVPVSSVFSTKIKIPKVTKKELRASITLEAASSIPHPIDAVSVDYQILSVLPDGKLEVLVVAVKNEIIASYQETFMEAGLELALIDIDAHAIENAIARSTTSQSNENIALINIGARYTSLNIVSAQQSLVTGDLSIGGKHLTEALMAELKLSADEVENLKKNHTQAAPEVKEKFESCCRKYADSLAGDLNRRLSLLWSSSGHEGVISSVILSGAGAQCFGLVEAITTKTGIQTRLFNPFKEGQISTTVPTAIQLQGVRFGIACGLAQRSPGDRVFPEGAFA